MKPTKKNKYLIVGGAGSVGRALQVRLPDSEFQIMDREQNPELHGNTRYFQCELSDVDRLIQFEKKCEDNLTVVFLAATMDNPRDVISLGCQVRDNIVGLGNVLYILRKKITDFIFLSSVAVYGIAEKLPTDEEQQVSPITLYGATKVGAEALAAVLCREFGITLSIIRATQLFGLPSAHSALPHALVASLENGKPLRINCDPEMLRDYLHVDDLVSLILKISVNPIAGIFNAGSGNAIRVGDLFKIAFESYGLEFCLDEIKGPTVEFSYSQVLDIDKVRKVYNFRPKITIEEWISASANHS